MGRKNQQYYSSGRWAKIWVFNPDSNANPVQCFNLNEKGKLNNPFKTKKHDRTKDHKKYLPDSCCDAIFSSSHASPPQPQNNEMEAFSLNVNGGQCSDDMTDSPQQSYFQSPTQSSEMDEFFGTPFDEFDFFDFNQDF